MKGKVIDGRAKSGIFIDPKMFDTKKGAIKMFASNKLQTEEVKYHNEQARKMDMLICRINEAYNFERDKDNVSGKWLVNVVASGNVSQDFNSDKTLYRLFNDFISRKQRVNSSVKNLISCFYSLIRYEIYLRESGRKHRSFSFDVDIMAKEDIEGYRNYISNEKKLSEKYPVIFEKIQSSENTGKCRVKERGNNTVCEMMKNFKSFFSWMNREGITDNRPFDTIEIGTQKYGTPFYITCEERDKIASTPMPTEKLERQRDIFVFQCLVGCRVSDLRRLTPDNITDGILVYTPHKTKEDGQQSLQARVPLHKKAIELIRKNAGKDRYGRLFPVTSNVTYNSDIKRIFVLSGINRMVEVRNPVTGEMENRPINAVASSHLARRTFVGNLYLKVADPNLIGKMSGHVEGSKSFARYRKIEDETLKNVIELL